MQEILRLSSSLSCMAFTASFRSSSLSKVTKPKPLDLPVILSSITEALLALYLRKSAPHVVLIPLFLLKAVSVRQLALTIFQLPIIHMPGDSADKSFVLRIRSWRAFFSGCVISAGHDVRASKSVCYAQV